MNFTAKIRDYIINESEINPFREKLNTLQNDMQTYLVNNKGSFGEYSIEVFEEVIKREKAIVSLQEIVASMDAKNRDLKMEILHDLALLKGGKVKLAIDDSSYLISGEDGQVFLGRAFD